MEKRVSQKSIITTQLIIPNTCEEKINKWMSSGAERVFKKPHQTPWLGIKVVLKVCSS
jgi:hypothetical protein